MKTERRRNKTEQKQKTINLPQLSHKKKLITIHTENIKLATDPKKKISYNHNNNKSLNEEKKYSLFNHYICKNSEDPAIYLRNAVKLSKKRTFNDYINIRQIGPSSDSFQGNKMSNIVDWEADQYQGQRPYNQDRLSCCPKMNINGINCGFFAVFDGHGGSSVSELLRVNLLKTFQKNLIGDPQYNIQRALKNSLQELEQKVFELSKSKTFDGGSCVSALVISQNKFYIAHLGDSRILKLQLNQIHQFKGQVQQLTRDHKPQDQHERRRIQDQGGRVYKQKNKTQSNPPYRVYPGKLSVTRTIGDINIKIQPNGGVITSKPSIIKGQLGDNTLFILCTDGAVQKFTNQQILSYFKTFNTKLSLRRSLQTFLVNSIMRESNDNISVISVLTAKY